MPTYSMNIKNKNLKENDGLTHTKEKEIVEAVTCCVGLRHIQGLRTGSSLMQSLSVPMLVESESI